MNRPNRPADDLDQDAGTAPDDDDEDVGGHLGSPANMESGVPSTEDPDDDLDDEAPTTS